jgi:hypothetical protein
MAYYILDGGKGNGDNKLNVVDDNIEQFKDVYPEIMKKVNKQKLDIIEPRISEVNSVYSLIREFIISKKRKIYGGYALNLLLMQKNKSLAFYDESDTPDIDFYSPEPLKDLKELCDIIYNAGFGPVVGQEAMHKETYAIFVNYKEYCNISYMPYNIYNKLKFIEYKYSSSKTMILTHPWFMMIDYFRMFTDPMISFWRLEKTYERYILLQKTYPLPLIKSPLIIPEYKNKDVIKYMSLLFNEIIGYNTLIFTGFYVYNYYLEQSGYSNNKPNNNNNKPINNNNKPINNNYKPINCPYYEAYSTNYIDDGLKIIQFIKSLNNDKLSYVEYYPFFQFYGFNVVIFYEDTPILYLYSNNKRCIPYKRVTIGEGGSGGGKKEVNIGSFDFNILHALIILVKVRVDNVDNWNDLLYKYISNIVIFRDTYLKKHSKTIYDDTIFQSFVIECTGEIIPPDRERRLRIEVKKKLGKPYIYKYEPSVSKNGGTFIFLNSSGNRINNNANLKLVESNKNNKNIELELEENEEREE